MVGRQNPHTVEMQPSLCPRHYLNPVFCLPSFSSQPLAIEVQATQPATSVENHEAVVFCSWPHRHRHMATRARGKAAEGSDILLADLHTVERRTGGYFVKSLSQVGN